MGKIVESLLGVHNRMVEDLAHDAARISAVLEPEEHLDVSILRQDPVIMRIARNQTLVLEAGVAGLAVGAGVALAKSRSLRKAVMLGGLVAAAGWVGREVQKYDHGEGKF